MSSQQNFGDRVQFNGSNRGRSSGGRGRGGFQRQYYDNGGGHYYNGRGRGYYNGGRGGYQNGRGRGGYQNGRGRGRAYMEPLPPDFYIELQSYTVIKEDGKDNFKYPAFVACWNSVLKQLKKNCVYNKGILKKICEDDSNFKAKYCSPDGMEVNDGLYLELKEIISKIIE